LKQEVTNTEPRDVNSSHQLQFPRILVLIITAALMRFVSRALMTLNAYANLQNAVARMAETLMVHASQIPKRSQTLATMHAILQTKCAIKDYVAANLVIFSLLDLEGHVKN